MVRLLELQDKATKSNQSNTGYMETLKEGLSFYSKL